MKTCMVEIVLTIPDNEAYTALTTLQRLGVEITDLRRADVWRFETQASQEAALIERVRTLETIYNPNKHKLRVLKHEAPEPGETWIDEPGCGAIERPVRISGRELPGVSRAVRYTGWRLFVGEGIPAPPEIVQRAVATFTLSSRVSKGNHMMFAPQLMNRSEELERGGFYTIATLGSHSALQILKGAHDEGFRTLAIANPETERLYRSFGFIDEVLVIERYDLFPAMVPELEKRKVIIVPHGSFVAYLSLEEHKAMTVPYFGNKAILDWEASRELQRQWLFRAGLTLPRQFKTGAEIDRPVIVKFYGALGGKGYLFLRDSNDFEERAAELARKNYMIQEYVIGVPFYIHYFLSPLTGKLEIMSMDVRYETNVDSLGRIPARAQEGMNVDPSYVVVGNSPVSLRESMLAEAYRMGEEVVRVSREICPPRGSSARSASKRSSRPTRNFTLWRFRRA